VDQKQKAKSKSNTQPTCMNFLLPPGIPSKIKDNIQPVQNKSMNNNQLPACELHPEERGK